MLNTELQAHTASAISFLTTLLQPLYWVNWERREEVGTPHVPGEADDCFVCLGV